MNRCLTFGLVQDQEKEKTDEKFDENEYQCYESIRSKMNTIFNSLSEIHRSKIQLATPEEVCLIF